MTVSVAVELDPVPNWFTAEHTYPPSSLSAALKMVNDGTFTVEPLYLLLLLATLIVVVTPFRVRDHETEVAAGLELTVHTKVTVLPNSTEYDGCWTVTVGGSVIKQV